MSVLSPSGIYHGQGSRQPQAKAVICPSISFLGNLSKGLQSKIWTGTRLSEWHSEPLGNEASGCLAGFSPANPNGLGCFDICCHEGMWVISQFTYWKYFKLFLQATKCNISPADLRYVLKLLKAISSEIEVCNLYSACRAVSLTRKCLYARAGSMLEVVMAPGWLW